MTIFLLSIIEKTIEGVMTRFSQLPAKSSLTNTTQQEILAKLTKRITETYVQFFHKVGIIPKEYQYGEATLVKNFDLLDHHWAVTGIEKKLFELIKMPLDTSVIPVNVYLYSSDKICWYTGIGIMESTDHSVVFFLQEFSIPSASIQSSPSVLRYIEEALDRDEPKSPRKLAAEFGKNYNQFQKDCNSYFGDTWYQFKNKMKMLNVLEDVLFTTFSFKEIAYRNDFSNYNSMYILFKKFKISLRSIPRLLEEV